MRNQIVMISKFRETCALVLIEMMYMYGIATNCMSVAPPRPAARPSNYLSVAPALSGFSQIKHSSKLPPDSNNATAQSGFLPRPLQVSP